MKMRINIHSAVAVYIQIENIIRFEVAAGKLKPGDQLPSVRELSEKLEINPNTVAKTYRDLEVMGFVYTRRGMGVYINKNTKAKAQAWVKEYSGRRLKEVAREFAAAGLSKSEFSKIANENFNTTSPVYG